MVLVAVTTISSRAYSCTSSANAAAAAAADEKRRKLLIAQGRGATILTAGDLQPGVQQQANIGRKTLLGQ